MATVGRAPGYSGDKGTMLTTAEFIRLVELLTLVNDLNVTQVDRDERVELDSLLDKLADSGHFMSLEEDLATREARGLAP